MSQTERSGAFDPARHGFGFRNPVERSGGRLTSLVYGRGLCFGMVVGSIGGYLRGVESASLRKTPYLLRNLRRLHLSQFRPEPAMKVASDWLHGKVVSPRNINLPHDPNPDILCFGPSRSRRFFANLGGSHAVVPYRKEDAAGSMRVFVYDPNHPKRRDRFVEFGKDGSFVYGGFSSAGGWAIYLMPFSVVSPPLWRVLPGKRPRSARPAAAVEPTL